MKARAMSLLWPSSSQGGSLQLVDSPWFHVLGQDPYSEATVWFKMPQAAFSAWRVESR
jgi:hypothetical protein